VDLSLINLKLLRLFFSLLIGEFFGINYLVLFLLY